VNDNSDDDDDDDNSDHDDDDDNSDHDDYDNDRVMCLPSFLRITDWIRTMHPL